MNRWNNYRQGFTRRDFLESTGLMTLALSTGILAGIPSPSIATDRYSFQHSERTEGSSAEFESGAALIWGRDNIWSPSEKVWVQYEPDLGERSAVDFENGIGTLQILLKSNYYQQSEIVLAHLRQGLSNLILKEPADPIEMVKTRMPEAQKKSPIEQFPTKTEVRVYIVRQGDDLWTIAKRFRMKTDELAKLNELEATEILQTGRPLKVKVFSSHNLMHANTLRPMAKDPLLLDQIKMTDGRPVPRWMVEEFVTEIVDRHPLGTENVVGEDGFERISVVVRFKLVKNHIEARARKYQPIVLAHAEEKNLDPALIMAMIHTESFFNPHARSNAPAYGLMQLVPHTAGQEAYQQIYGQKGKLTPQYLYDPTNNIKLGTTYFSMLSNKYMGSILDPDSRTYCAVAAYNAGASNVGRAFIPEKSIVKATPVINSMKPNEVYSRLVNSLPARESRSYVRKVLKRINIYSDWFRRKETHAAVN